MPGDNRNRPCGFVAFRRKKIPELMKGLGKGVRSFKEGMNEIERDIQSEDSDAGKK